MFSLLLLISTVATVFAGCPNKIVLFGDSLSDNGNGVGQLYGGFFPLPPYFHFRFCNGPVWIENIPTVDLLDYAYGGAVINQSASNNGPPSLMAQVNDYLISKHFKLDDVAEDTQYIWWGGANDIFDVLSTEGVGPSLAALAVGIPFLTASQIGKLIHAGAKNILILLLPTWSNSPLITPVLSPAQLQALSQFNDLVNAGIVANVTAITPPDVNLKFFDTVGFTKKIFENPAHFGVVNLTAPCLTNFEIFLRGVGGQAPIVCSNPDEFFFWDGEHPTTRVQKIFAKAVMKLLDWQG
jgi:phospholipase/lecithinase/hemolysin